MNANTITAAAFAKVPRTLTSRVTFTRIVPGTPDPITDSPGSTSTQQAAGSFVVQVATPRGNVTDLQGFRDGETIRESGRILIGVLDAGFMFQPESGDTATWDGVTWGVVGGAPVPGGAYRVAVTR